MRNFYKYLFIAIGVGSCYASIAQQKYQQPIVWREAGVLPRSDNKQTNIGLSGIITGIIGRGPPPRRRGKVNFLMFLFFLACHDFFFKQKNQKK